ARPRAAAPRGARHRAAAVRAAAGRPARVGAGGCRRGGGPAPGTSCCRIAEPPPVAEDGAVFSADGKLLAIGHRDSILRVWDATTGKLLRSFPQSRGSFPHALAFSPDGRLVAPYSSAPSDRAAVGAVRLWDTTTGQERARLPWPEDTSPASVVFTADGRRLLVSYDPQRPAGKSRDRIGLCLWDVT